MKVPPSTLQSLQTCRYVLLELSCFSNRAFKGLTLGEITSLSAKYANIISRAIHRSLTSPKTLPFDRYKHSGTDNGPHLELDDQTAGRCPQQYHRLTLWHGLRREETL